MIIDEDILKDGINDTVLAKLISEHSLERDRLDRLYDYYIGNHAICSRHRVSSASVNNKIVCNP